jgi:hypothetical protein
MPKERLRDSLDDLEALSGAAAEALGIPDPAFVEKDFWVVELLRSLVRPLAVEATGKEPASAEVLFKGGTSLSKAYGLIDRFSEDVDILVICRGLGRQTTDTRVLRPLCERARADLGLDETAVEWLAYSTGRTRNALYRYPRRLTSPATRCWRHDFLTTAGLVSATLFADRLTRPAVGRGRLATTRMAGP